MNKRHSIPELDKLFEDIGTYRDSKDYIELLEFVKRFRKTAPYNAMLLHIQKPGCLYATSASDWKYRFGRDVKPGARPLVILRPFGPVAFVYDLGDTEGKAFPTELTDPFHATSESVISDARMKSFIGSMYLAGFDYHEQDYGTGMAGFVKKINSRGTYKVADTQKSFKLPFVIVVNKNLPNAAKLATLYHELAHVFCGHLPAPELKFLPQRLPLSGLEREFEAESVSWLLCERQGIHNPSKEYLADYLGHNDTIPYISVDTVLRATGEIEKIWKGINKPRKELMTD